MSRLRKIHSIACGLAGLLASLVPQNAVSDGFGKTYIPIQYSTGEVVPGEWNINFEACKAYSDENLIPMVVFCGNQGCGHCQDLQTACNSELFLAWQQRKQVVMSFNYLNRELERFTTPDRSINAGLPYISVYWPKKDGSVFQMNFSGVAGRMPSTTGATLEEQFVNSLDLYLKSYPYDGGDFVLTGEDERHRLELAPGYSKTAVDVPLTRGVSGTVARNRLNCNGVDYEVVWAADELSKTVRVEVPQGLASGAEVVLTLYDAENNLRGTSRIVVANRETSLTNPLWIDEKSPDELGHGEWTMDLVAAESKEDRNYTLVYFTGALWCPWCQGLEDGVLSKPEFKAWTERNKITCVCLDNCKRSPDANPTKPNGAPPTLLRYEVGNNSYLGCTSSGGYYLSRKAIDTADAEQILQRNHTLGYPGGRFCAPEAARTGYPTLILVRKDGAIAGRFKSYGPDIHSYDTEENLARLDDLIRLAETGKGEGDNYITTTKRVLVCGEAVSSDFQINDAVEVFRLANVKVGTIDFAVAGKTKDVPLTLSLIQVDGGVQTVLATGSESVSFDFMPNTSSNVYLKITAFEKAQKWGANTAFSAEVTSSITLHPGKISFVNREQWFLEKLDSAFVTVRRTGGVSGEIRAKVVLDPTRSEAVNGDRYVWTDTEVVWEEGDEEDKVISFKLRDNGRDDGRQTFLLTLSGIQPDRLGDIRETTVGLFDTDKPALAFETYDIKLYSTFDGANAFGETLYNAPETGRVVVKKLGGKLPSGIKIKYDGTSQQVFFSGSTAKVGDYLYEGAFGATAKDIGPRVGFKISVVDPEEENAYLSRVMKMTVPLFLSSGESGDMQGVVLFQQSAKNKLTAKYTDSRGKSVQFKGLWQSMEKGTAMTCLTDASNRMLEIVLAADGRFALRLDDVVLGISMVSGELNAGDWLSACSFDGRYTVALPTVEADELAGAGYLTLKVSEGKVAWTGALGNGQKVSGTSYLAGDSRGLGVLAVHKVSSKFSFSGALLLRPNAASASKRRAVKSMEGTSVNWSMNGYLHRCKAYGSWYDQTVGLDDCCIESSLPTSLYLISDVDAVQVVVGAKGFTLVDADPYHKLKFSPNTGMISGFVPFGDGSRKASFNGVIIPGWYDCGCEVPDPSDLFKIEVSQPFALGAAVFNGEADGRKVKCGHTVSIDLLPEER